MMYLLLLVLLQHLDKIFRLVFIVASIILSSVQIFADGNPKNFESIFCVAICQLKIELLSLKFMRGLTFSNNYFLNCKLKNPPKLHLS